MQATVQEEPPGRSGGWPAGNRHCGVQEIRGARGGGRRQFQLWAGSARVEPVFASLPSPNPSMFTKNHTEVGLRELMSPGPYKHVKCIF